MTGLTLLYLSKNDVEAGGVKMAETIDVPACGAQWKKASAIFCPCD